jgi:hypothetical protein
MNRISRRRFLRAAATSAALPYFVPASVLGAEAPSRKITIGFIGTGDHGTQWNLTRYLELPAAKVLMVCDVDGYRMRRAKAMVDAKYDTEDCAMSKDFRDVLARKDIDAVMISTPDHWHTLISVMAARVGKDVQCEKPTLTISEGKILIDTMRKLGRVFQTSTEDRSLPRPMRRTAKTACTSTSGGSGITPAASFATGARTFLIPRSGRMTPSAPAPSKWTGRAPTGRAACITP